MDMTLQSIKSELNELKTLLTNFISGGSKAGQAAGAGAADAASLQGKIINFETVLNGQLAEKDQTISDQDATIKDLQGKLKTAQDEASTLKTENATLKTNVESEKKRANDTLAKLGIDASQLPAAEASEGGKAADKETEWAKYHRLQQTNPREAGQFWAQNADKILATKPKS